MTVSSPSTLRPKYFQGLGPTIRGQDPDKCRTDKEDANSGITMVMARARRPPEDAGRVGFLSFTFAFFSAKEE